MRNTHQRYRKDIDGLRAISIFAVLIFHFAPALMPNGFLGVDVFFVISGFLVSNIYFSENSNFRLGSFYLRRARRLLPPMVLVVSSGLLASKIIFTQQEQINIFKNAISSQLFIANAYSYKAVGYFEDSALRAPLLHLWSLSVEWQFYILFGIIVVISRKKNIFSWFLPLFLLVVSLTISVQLKNTDAAANFYFAHARAWEFLVGVVLAKVMRKHNLLIRSLILRDMAVIVGFSCLAAVFIFTGIPGPKILLPQLVAVLSSALIVSQAYENRIKFLVSNRLITYLGKLSYSLYLWHWMVYSMCFTVFGNIPTIRYRLFLIAGSLVLASVTYEFLEKRVANGSISNKSIGVAALVLLFVSIGLVARINNQENGKDPFAEMAIGFPRTNEVCLKNYPYSLEFRSHWFCLQSENTSPQIVLLGNSFANHHYYGMAERPELVHRTILSIGICDAASPPSKGEADYLEGVDSNCTRKNQQREQKFIDAIILNSHTVKFVIVDGLRRDPDEKYIKRLAGRLSKFENAGIQVIVMYPHFLHHVDINRCFDRPFLVAINCDFGIDEVVDLRHLFAPLINSFSSGHPLVKFYDQNDLFCSDKFCSPVQDGHPLTGDLRSDGHGGHFNRYGSEQSAKLFIDWLRINEPRIFES